MSNEVGLVLTDVEVSQDRLCIVEFGVSGDCDEHRHVMGARHVKVRVQAEGSPEKLAEMVGKRFRVEE